MAQYMSPPTPIWAAPSGGGHPMTPWLQTAQWKDVSFGVLLESLSRSGEMYVRVAAAYSNDRLRAVHHAFLEPDPTSPAEPGWRFLDKFIEAWKIDESSGLYVRFALDVDLRGDPTPAARPFVLARATMLLRSHS